MSDESSEADLDAARVAKETADSDLQKAATLQSNIVAAAAATSARVGTPELAAACAAKTMAHGACRQRATAKLQQRREAGDSIGQLS